MQLINLDHSLEVTLWPLMLGTCFKFVTEIKHELFFCTDPNFERRITTGNGSWVSRNWAFSSVFMWRVDSFLFTCRVKRKPRRILNWLHPVVHYKVVPSVRLSTRSSSVMPWVLWPHASYFLITLALQDCCFDTLEDIQLPLQVTQQQGDISGLPLRDLKTSA